MDLNDLRIDPEFEEKIPPLTEDEFLLLEQNITNTIKLFRSCYLPWIIFCSGASGEENVCPTARISLLCSFCILRGVCSFCSRIIISSRGRFCTSATVQDSHEQHHNKNQR